MDLLVNISFVDFKTLVTNSIEENPDFSIKDYQEFVGETVLKFASKYVDRYNERRMDWPGWLASQEFGETTEFFSAVTRATATNTKNRLAASKWAFAFHFRLHAHFDGLERYAWAIDELVFGERLDARGRPVFLKPSEGPSKPSSSADQFPQNLDRNTRSSFSGEIQPPIEESQIPPSAGDDVELEPHLSLPALSTLPYHYTNKKVDVLGRDAEKSALDRFCDAGAGFKWWQISGVGGQGKSRLALDLVRKLEDLEGWSAGFLNQDSDNDELGWFAEFCSGWVPQKNYLIVVDYVLTRTVALRKAIHILCKRSNDFGHSIRLLIVERQSWNMQELDVSGASAFAEWFCSISERGDGYDPLVRNSLYSDREFSDVLELTPLGRSHLRSLVYRILELARATHEVDERWLDERLAQIDDKGRPLYALLLGRAIAADMRDVTGSAADLLNWVLWSDRKKRWQAAGFMNGQDAPKVGSVSPNLPGISGKNPSMHLALLATIARFVECNSLTESYTRLGWASHNSQILREAHLISDTPLAANPNTLLLGLEPDLLGEFFVLESVRRQQSFLEIFDLGWAISALATSDFLSRAIRDFPNHAIIEKVVSTFPKEKPDGLTAVEFAEVGSSILWALVNNGHQVPSSCFDAMKQGALAASPKFANDVGYCYHKGIGVPEDKTVARQWFERAAKLGAGVAMNNLGICYRFGEGGVKVDPQAALSWFKKGIESGDTNSMASLANCYGQGIVGVDFDPSEAYRIYRSAEMAGHNDWDSEYDIVAFLAKEVGRSSRLSNRDVLIDVCEDFPELDSPALSNGWKKYRMSRQESKSFSGALVVHSRDVASRAITIGSCRRTSVPCYPELDLLEVAFSWDDDRQNLTATLLAAPWGMFLLGSKLRDLDRVNRCFLALRNDEDALEYLRLYCSSYPVKGEFHSVLGVEDYELLSRRFGADFSYLHLSLKEPIMKIKPDLPRFEFGFKTFVSSGTYLLSVDFHISRKGQVKRRNVLVAERDVPFREFRRAGPFRLLGDPRHGC